MKKFLPLFLVVASSALAASPLEDKGRPVATTEALPAAEAAKQFKLPPGFSVQVVAAEPEVVQPVAYAMDDRGRLWVVENTNYPNCPGEPKDRILIFEDFDAAGKARKRTVFYDKLTFATGIAVGHGGVWVGAPPNLLFFPRKDGDDKAAGEPQIVLNGWGNEDTHETLNDFTWGPDGWLYGTQGIFTNSNVGRPGAPDSERVKLNGSVWRYHPVKKKNACPRSSQSTPHWLLAPSAYSSNFFFTGCHRHTLPLSFTRSLSGAPGLPTFELVKMPCVP